MRAGLEIASVASGGEAARTAAAAHPESSCSEVVNRPGEGERNAAVAETAVVEVVP